MSETRTALSVVEPKTAEPKRNGRPRKMLTPQQIVDLEKLAETGANRPEMAAMLGMDEDTLAKRLKDQPEVFMAMARAGARMRVSIRRKQVAVALNDKHPAQATMLVWLGKATLGQSDRVTLKIETPQDAFDRLKMIWPEIDSDELIKQLTAGPSAIDAEVVSEPIEEEQKKFFEDNHELAE